MTGMGGRELLLARDVTVMSRIPTHGAIGETWGHHVDDVMPQVTACTLFTIEREQMNLETQLQI